MKERMKLRIEKSKVRSINRTSHFSLGTSFGFTLIELSIVLIIISLIVAGITGGKALIRASEIQSITGNLRSFKTAINTFKLQYDALPGDIGNASDYWPNPICIVNVVIALCDGNNNNQLEEGEGPRVWHHLQLAELIEGDFSSANTYPSPSPVGVSGFWVGNVVGTTVPFLIPIKNQSGHYLAGQGGDKSSWITTTGPISGTLLSGGPFLPKDAKSIDSKIDDGLPDSGDLRKSSYGGAPCDPGITGKYDLISLSNGCGIMIKI